MATVENLVARLARALQPLTLALTSPERIRVFAASLGWTLPSVPPSLIALREPMFQLHTSLADLSVARAKEDRGEEASPTAAAALSTVLADLATALDALYQLSEQLRSQLPAPFVAATRIDEEFAERAIDWLISIESARSNAVVHHAVRVAGVIEVEVLPEDPARFQPAFERHRIRWHRLPQLIDPASLMRDVYGWGTPAIDTERLFRELVPLSFALGMPADVRYASPTLMQRLAPSADPAAEPLPHLWIPVLQTESFTFFLVAAAAPNASANDAQAVMLALVPSAAGDQVIPIGDGLELEVRASAQVGSGAALIVRPDGTVSALLDMDAAFGTALTSGQVGVRLTWREDEENPSEGMTASDRSGLSVRSASIGVGAQAAAHELDVFAELRLDDAALVVAAPDDDGLLASVLPEDGLKASFSVAVRWSRDGVRFEGSGGLATLLPLRASFGPLRLESLEVGVASKDGTAFATAAVNGSVELGPIDIALQGIGVALEFRAERGNLGPVDVDMHFKRPDAVGISIDATVVTGGGAIRYEPLAKRYSGILQLQAGEVGVTGVCVLDTRLPGVPRGYALLIALRATFPAIQIGFGFALTSVGGLVALNRRVNVDALRARLAAGTAGRLLAPADPVRDAPALFADLDVAFPVTPGIVVVGPTAQIVWADLVHFDIGVFLELPGPARVVILGSAHASIEADGRSYVSLRVDIVGVVDFQRAVAAFDAVLIRSTLFEVLELTGGAAFRLSWGDQPYAVLTFGGFHPAYNPEPLAFPSSLTRIAMVYGKPNDRLFLRFEGYFAVTSNTLQFGANVQATIKAGGFNIQGILGFDALIQRHPFHFQVDVRASVRVRYKSHNLAGLTLTGALSGPGPIVLRAKVCIELLFFDICFSDTFRIGSSEPAPSAIVASALDVILAELDRPGALEAADTIDRFVVLRPLPANATIVPAANRIVWVQRQAPLGLLLQRIQGAPLANAQSVDASSIDAAPELDWFAPGSFAELSTSQALTRRAFERLPGGLRIGGGSAADGPSQQQTLTIKQIRLPAKARSVRTPEAFPSWILKAAAASTGRPQSRPIVPAVSVSAERWSVADPVSGAITTGLTAAQAHHLASLADRARGRVASADVDRLADVVFQ
jgi:hypothetical protein